jgi:hypothetical protein
VEERGTRLSSTKNLLLAALILAPLAASAEDAKAPKVTFSGMIDGYYTLNLSHAQDYWSPTQTYSAPTGFNFNFAKLTTVAELDPVTFRLDVGYGKEGAAIGNVLVQQAYASMKFKSFTLEAGRFVTPAGFEVFEAKDNWVYTKGLIFNFAVPTAHEGVRVAVPLSPELTLTGYLVNGSNLFDNDLGSPGDGGGGAPSLSPYFTGILNAVYVKDATTLAVTGFVTKDPATLQTGYLLDAVFTQTMGQLSLNLSGDYGSFAQEAPFASYSWFAVGASAKYQVSDPLKVVGRIEYFDDPDGVRTGFGADINVLSVTGGIGYAIGSNAELRGELRLDRASEDAYRSAKDTMITAHAAAIAWF